MLWLQPTWIDVLARVVAALCRRRGPAGGGAGRARWRGPGVEQWAEARIHEPCARAVMHRIHRGSSRDR